MQKHLATWGNLGIVFHAFFPRFLNFPKVFPQIITIEMFSMNFENFWAIWEF